MSEQRVTPARRIDGEVRVGGDKSISHRALIVAGLAEGRSYLGNLSPAADVQATARCLGECGVWLRDFQGGRMSVEGSGGRRMRQPAQTLDCANSGTTMRLLAGVLAAQPLRVTLDGDESLRRRPMRRIAEPLGAMGAVLETAPGGTPPVVVQGRSPLRAIRWKPEVASAQVKSAILLAGLRADAATSVAEPLPTRDHTERLLRRCGIQVACAEGVVSVQPGVPQAFGLRIPGDLSTAAFFLALGAARPGWRVRCPGVGVNPHRTGVLDVLRAMGGAVEEEPVAAPSAPDDDAAEPVADLTVRGAALRGVRISGALTVRCIDELPVLAVLATQCEGVTEIRDAAELRTKESDRISALAEGLRAFGAECETHADGISVQGPVRLRAARVSAQGDHRLAMAWGVAAALADGGDSLIDGAESAAVSEPDFFALLGELAQR